MAGIVAKFAAALVAVATLADPNPSLATAYYVKPAQVDLIHILAPPPAPNSLEGEADLQSVLDAQHHRAPAEVKMARADEVRSVFRFATVLGPAFKPENLPFATQFFARAFANDEYVIEPVKSYFKRPRPFLTDHRVKPVVDATMTDGSYPSSHSTFAYATAILLADMVPEKAAAIFARATAEVRQALGLPPLNSLNQAAAATP
jgi:acid phosphatase (class A)